MADNNINLDLVDAAEREGAGEAPTVTFGGKTYTLPIEIPAAMLTVGETGSVIHICKALFGDDWEEVFIALSVPRLTKLVQELNRVYGVSAGESSASAASS